MDKKKVLIVIAGLAAVGTAVYFIFRKDTGKVGSFIRKGESLVKGEELSLDTTEVVVNNTNPMNQVLNPSGLSSSSGSYPCASYKAESFPLVSGMKGDKSKALQQAINKVYNQNLVVDGCFGPKSVAAVNAAIAKNTVTVADYERIMSAYAASMIINPFG